MKSLAVGIGPPLVIATAFAAFDLARSFRSGRLRQHPIYDDVSYLAAGLDWLGTLRRGGLTGAFRLYRVDPPHSPAQTAMAVLAFATLGVRPAAAYLFNLPILFALLAACRALLVEQNRAVRWSVLFFVAACPLSRAAIVYFRPDVACAVATATALILLLMPASTSESSPARLRLLPGFLLGVALLIKPTVFPLTLLLTLTAILFLKPWTRDGARHAVAVLLPMVALACLFYPFGYRAILEYLRGNLVGRDARLWEPATGFWPNATYYLWGLGGQTLLGWSLAPLFACAAAGSCLIWRDAIRRRGVPWRWIAMAALLIESFLVPAVNPVKNEFLGSTFAALLVLLGVIGIGRLLRQLRGDAGRAMAAIALLICGGVGWATSAENRPPLSTIDRQNRTIDRVLDAIAVAPVPGPAPTVFVTSAGPLNAHTLRFMAAVRGIDLSCVELHRSDDLDAYRQAFQRADWVVASTPDNPDVYQNLPSTRIQGACLDVLNSSDSRFKLEAACDGYRVFRRRPL